MSGNEIRAAYLKFMEERGHTIVPSSALVPENDPTTLFTGSGMQPLMPFLMGEPHPKGTRVVDSQKCFRAEDIEEVGDNRHTTFFEMLGNWSFGDYFKEEQLTWFYSFLTDTVGLDPERLYVTVFQGDEEHDLPRDTDSVAIWQRLFDEKGVSNEVADIGSEAAGGKRGINDGERIFYYDAKKNWWSRAGKPANMPVGEPGGPDSEMFYDFGIEHNPKFGTYCHPNCDCGRFMEIGNSVFMEYLKTENGFKKLPKQNVDFGGGLERIVAASLHSTNGVNDVFKTDLFAPTMAALEQLSGKTYTDNLLAFRVIADHLRGAVFMIGDGILPGNTEQGYFVRRLIRRAVRYADMLGVPEGNFAHIADSVINLYHAQYPNLKETCNDIKTAIEKEEAQFRKTLTRGLAEFEKIAQGGAVTGTDAFVLFTTYGFPYELTEELATERNLSVDRKEFEAQMAEHQEKSRLGAEQKFKGGLADNSEKVLQYHTTTHLLLAALREILGNHVHQAGSNITGERLRFDFTHPEKVERETLDRIETWVNNAITVGGDVTITPMSKVAAESDPTVEGSFWDRYPDEVNVYQVTGNDGTIFSKELCGGPHVGALGDIRGTFKITKEESSSAGVRRIKAVLE
ncbi:alanine--tRNA ligase [Candidatus Kaiserbacteria bacterium]|nr:alanine--tRNA ligase [Candidatus Kaiserbacteria bacterium]